MEKVISDTKEAISFLETKLGLGVTNVACLKGGEWSTAFEYTLNNKAFVVRFGQHVDDYRRDEIASGYSSVSLPIPKILEVGKAFSGYYAISEKAFGVMLDDISGEEIGSVLPSLFDAIKSASIVDLSNRRGFGIWESDGNAPFNTWSEALKFALTDSPSRRTFGWRDKLSSYPHSLEVFNLGYTKFIDLVKVCPNVKNLIHSDLLNRNVIVRDNKVSAIIDWGCSMYGDYLYDVAWLIYNWPSYSKWKDIDIVSKAKEYFVNNDLTETDFDNRIECYLLHIGLDAMAYNAFKERKEELEVNTNRIMELVPNTTQN